MAAWVTPRRRSSDRLNRRPATEARGRPTGNGTAPSRFGHFCAEVPKSLHIGAHPRVFQFAAVRRAAAKPLQVVTFAAGWPRR